MKLYMYEHDPSVSLRKCLMLKVDPKLIEKDIQKVITISRPVLSSNYTVAKPSESRRRTPSNNRQHVCVV
jgi:hypothetical protein